MVNKTYLPYEFNLRDIKLFSLKSADAIHKSNKTVDFSKFKTYKNNSLSEESYQDTDIMYNVAISWFKNGLLFYSVSSNSLERIIASFEYEKHHCMPFSKDNNSFINYNKESWVNDKNVEILKLTYRLAFRETGRLFTFSDYFNDIDTTPFYIYLTHSTLPAVHEIIVNPYLSVNRVRSYIVYDEYKGRLIGSDVLSVNEVYIAHLMYDLERMVEIIRIYYRHSSNFAFGHTDILLDKFITRVSVVSFLDFSNNPFIFVQNSCIAVLYKINDLIFEIDTVNIKEKYSKYANKTYRVDMLAYNEEKPIEKAVTSFHITFTDDNDMNSYFTGDFDTFYFGYSYGDKSFSKVVSNFYMGPDLKFNLSLKSNSEYIKSLVLPNITNTQEKSNIREFHTSDEWGQSFFNRYSNLDTGIENIAFYCIQNSAIEEHIFRTKDLIETRKEIFNYSRYSFVDFYVNLNDKFNLNDFTDFLVVLGIQKTYYEEQYFLHYFELKDDVITWRRKVSKYQ